MMDKKYINRAVILSCIILCISLISCSRNNSYDAVQKYLQSINEMRERISCTVHKYGHICKEIVVYIVNPKEVPQELIQKYGMSFNEKRKEVGLSLLTEESRLVEADYFGYNNNKCDILWENNKPLPYQKIILLTNDSIETESDRYKSSEQYETIDCMLNKYMEFTYNFKENNFKYEYTDMIKPSPDERFYIFDIREVSQLEADSIIASWGYNN